MGAAQQIEVSDGKVVLTYSYHADDPSFDGSWTATGASTAEGWFDAIQQMFIFWKPGEGADIESLTLDQFGDPAGKPAPAPGGGSSVNPFDVASSIAGLLPEVGATIQGICSLVGSFLGTGDQLQIPWDWVFQQMRKIVHDELQAAALEDVQRDISAVAYFMANDLGPAGPWKVGSTLGQNVAQQLTTIEQAVGKLCDPSNPSWQRAGFAHYQVAVNIQLAMQRCAALNAEAGDGDWDAIIAKNLDTAIKYSSSMRAAIADHRTGHGKDAITGDDWGISTDFTRLHIGHTEVDYMQTWTDYDLGLRPTLTKAIFNHATGRPRNFVVPWIRRDQAALEVARELYVGAVKGFVDATFATVKQTEAHWQDLLQRRPVTSSSV